MALPGTPKSCCAPADPSTALLDLARVVAASRSMHRALWEGTHTHGLAPAQGSVLG